MFPWLWLPRQMIGRSDKASKLHLNKTWNRKRYGPNDEIIELAWNAAATQRPEITDPVVNITW